MKKIIVLIFAGVFLSNFLIIILGKLFIRYFVKVVELPYTILGPAIIILSIVGSFAVRNNMGDVLLMFGFGLMGYFLEKYGYPITPMVIGLVLGPITESELRRAMLLSNNDPLYLISRPISAALLASAVFFIFFPLLRKYWQSRRRKACA